jgi:hypothetical protein
MANQKENDGTLPTDNIIKKYEFSTPPININDKKMWSKTWNNEMLIIGNIYKVGNEFCVYVGDFKSEDDVPIVFCCYTLGDEMRVRHLTLDAKSEIPVKERRKRADDDRPIDTTIKNTDNTLMLLIKSALQQKNITRGDFRRLYPNTSDMNNILRCIENGERLSWPKFTDLAEKLHITYSLEIFDEDNNVICSTE